ncbi:MAG: hypothetical protein LBD41_03100 [Clostridiales Family XIII bacterium]|nr:hypothetical protein [Clostridiales Family XIII bacterium]
MDGTQQCFPYCIKCHNEKHSKQEKEVVTFIRSIYSGEIIENSRQIIPPKELDIYLPEFKLAIEYCGIAWHSSKFLNKNYHLDKLNLCKEKNIDLLQIWSTEWLYQKDIIKSIIQARLKLNQTKIFARKCIIKELNILEYKKFLQDNHLQGYGLAKIKLGLFCNNELIKVLSFSKSRFNKNYEYELIRECNKLNYQIVGGKQKLLRYFENTYNPKSIISYCNKRLFNGNSYNHFQKKEDSPINYYYLIGHDKLTSRIEFQKHKLNKLKTFDKNLTEEQNMENNGFYRIYDCGNFVFTKKY